MSFGPTWIPPDLSPFEATPAERAYAKKFTKIQAVEDSGRFKVFLRIAHQSFELAIESEDAKYASWRCWMLAKSLLRVCGN